MDSRAKTALMLLNMFSQLTSLEELVDEAIQALTNYKLSGFKEDDRPIRELMMLMHKFKNEGKDFIDIMEDLDKVEQASNLYDKISGKKGSEMN